MSATIRSDTLADRVTRAIEQVVRPEGDAFVPLHEPVFEGREREYVLECIDTGWVSSVGSFVDRFEVELAEFCGVKRAVATVNGTAALHTCLLLAGVKPGDEVIVPSLTFVATANAVTYCGAIPHFVDVEEKTLGLDPDKLGEYLESQCERRTGGCFNRNSGRRIAAIVPMHTFGHPVRIEELMEVANARAVPVVEDAAESLGSTYRGRHTGGFGLLGALSFNGNKIITTGGGGAILTDDQRLADQAKHLTTTAKVPHRWKFEHDAVGYNYRMPNLNAALGLAQLEQLLKKVARKRELAARYARAFSGEPRIRVMREPENTEANYWLNTLILDTSNSEELESVLEATNNTGLMTRSVWTPLHQLPIYGECPRAELPVTEGLAQRIINVPSTTGMGEFDHRV